MSLLYIFDFDGTLADTHGSIVRTFQLTLERMAWQQLTEREIRACIGLSLMDMFRSIGMNDVDAEKACAIYSSEFDAIAAGNVRLYEGVTETLQRLHQAGHTLAIASSRNSASLVALTQEFNLYHLFSEMMGANTVQHHKPHPEAVLRILELTGFSAEQAVVIGDATFDILMGNAAGCRTVAVTYGNQSRAELQTANPTYTIEAMPELLNLAF